MKREVTIRRQWKGNPVFIFKSHKTGIFNILVWSLSNFTISSCHMYCKPKGQFRKSNWSYLSQPKMLFWRMEIIKVWLLNKFIMLPHSQTCNIPPQFVPQVLSYCCLNTVIFSLVPWEIAPWELVFLGNFMTKSLSSPIYKPKIKMSHNECKGKNCKGYHWF